MKKSYFPIERLIRIDEQLRNKTYPDNQKLANSLDVDPRTIRRDIEQMRLMGAEIEYDHQKRGYYYVNPNVVFPGMILKGDEVLYFQVAEKILKQYENTPYYHQVKGAVDKILSFVSEEVTSEKFANYFDFQQMPAAPIDQKNYLKLETAIHQEVEVIIRYYSMHRDETSERQVAPYHILNQSGSWYLIGYCHTRKEIRTFSLSRIQEITLTEEYFERPPDFDLQEYLGKSFRIIREGQPYLIQLKFSAYQARWIREKQWHPTQKLTPLADGSLLLELEVAGLSEVKRWILQYGAEVEVLAPQELREEMKKEIDKMKMIYSTV
ncbi:WYL domain-containing transcriptional regulator [candidate division KSB1 bacterium]|nr:WYL domain-containing transcriptional regulator [candidate division KSB1 bacterium]